MSNIDRLAYAKAGSLFHIANTAAKSVIAVAAAMTGVILHNPQGSNKKLAIVDVGFAWTTVPGAVHNLGIGIVAPELAAPTSLTAIGSGVQSADGSGTRGKSVAYGYDAATFAVAPVARQWFGGAAWGTSVGVSPYLMVDTVDGGLIVPPGASACLIVVTTTAIGLGSLSWIEID